jgi:succinylarginine dihydrolase
LTWTVIPDWTEINFDGLVGPSHNFAGLSRGNIASASHAGHISHPRAAALQGLGKMRLMLDLGLHQGFLPPLFRPNVGWLRTMGFDGNDAGVCARAANDAPHLLNIASSASAMWTANAATVSPSPDSKDGRLHLLPANLSSMPHRAMEWAETARNLAVIFGEAGQVHPPVPASFGDEGAANHMRFCEGHGAEGVQVFVYGNNAAGRFPARQNEAASRAVARACGVKNALFVQQSDAAIEAGAFHNDVVAVANETVLFTHELAFADASVFYDRLRVAFPALQVVEVPDRAVSLADAIGSYLFNSQLITLPDGSNMLICPMECAENVSVKGWLEGHVGGNRPIHAVKFVDVRQSMHNGGGPACLRLRVVMNAAERAAMNRGYLLNAAKIDALEVLVAKHWPEAIAPMDLRNPDLWEQLWSAHGALSSWIADQ